MRDPKVVAPRLARRHPDWRAPMGAASWELTVATGHVQHAVRNELMYPLLRWIVRLTALSIAIRDRVLRHHRT